MKMNYTDISSTQDMGLAVALLCCGYTLNGLTPTGNGRRIAFEFNYSPNLAQDENRYWEGSLQVDAKQYWNESKNLKTRLYSLRQS